ncbi:MAG: type IV secretion system protein [Campylobacteraceae bacterium]|nr:type IV secretion system protein [Campylobacteraceae bacterium]
MAGIFQNIQNQVDDIVVTLSDAMVSQMIQDLQSILVVSITIYIIYKAYLIWAGKIQEPMKDILWDFASKAVIIAFVFNANGWLELSVDAINSFHDWAAGDSAALFANLDSIVSKAIKMDESILAYNQDNIYPFIVTGKWIGVGLGLAVPFFTMMLAKIALQILVITAPIFIFCKLFGFMKGVFASWLRLVITNILITLFLTLLIQSSKDFMEWLVDQCMGLVANGSQMVFFLIIGGIFQAAMAKLAVSIAQGIASVDIENLKTVSSNSTNNNIAFGNSYNSNSASNNTAAMITRSFFTKVGSGMETAGRNISQNTSKAFRQYKNNLFRDN